MRILMTGSHGFVGTNLVEALSDEYEIIRWDVRSDRELPDCDAVIHLAGKAHDVRCKKEDGREYFEVNTELTKNIYDAFLKSKAKKFIFFSSIKAKDGDTPYARSKKEAEEYILNQLIVKSEKLKNRDTYILRPCMIHGKGNKGNLNLLVKWVKKGLPWPLAAFENKRSYASIGNVSFIVEQLLSKNVESGIYEVCDDEPVSTNDMIDIIYENMGRKSRMLRIPRSLMKFGARIGDLLQLPLNSERLGKLTADYVVDNKKIKQALGIETLPVDAKDGLRISIQSMLK